jgi:hypothetical protein
MRQDLNRTGALDFEEGGRHSEQAGGKAGRGRMDDNQKIQEKWRWLRAANVGMGIAGPIVFLGALGFHIDHRRGGGVRFTLTGLFLGLFSSVYELWKLVRELDKK